MPRIPILIVAALAAICLSWVTTTVVEAADHVCTGAIGAESYENLEVPAGASCTLSGTRVDGNIAVGANATLHAVEVVVGGNIQAEGAADVMVSNGSTVGGSVQAKQGGSVTVDQAQVTGDVQLESNAGALSATKNRVGGNVQVFQNRGGATTTDNRIDGNLQCKENTPAPTGGRNQAASFEDQCAGFAGAPASPPVVPEAGANSVICQGIIGAQSFASLAVPDGANCTLVGTRVTGDLTIGVGATLQASGLLVDGHIRANGAAVVTINNNSTVGGNLQIRHGGSATVDQVQVAGDLSFESNQRALSVTRNRVGGNLQAVANAAGVVVRDNAIDGALQCQNNLITPLLGANQAASQEEQCAALSRHIFLPLIVAQR